ncbi:uncharacterized protein pre-mod(mdg4)-AB isoform X2 [Maniola hyperantus]|uniref:uncharacterized protein pre-mod(mdg4)-AB isoform X2 n=1 Tax=Aphantopus hyperantus TaxID=2795564 RepID=UPI003749D874
MIGYQRKAKEKLHCPYQRMGSIIFRNGPNPDRVEFVQSQRGNVMIRLNGYTYSQRPSTGIRTRWRCSTHQNRGCFATIHMVEDTVIFTKETHSHPPSVPRCIFNL